jgi:MinD-like ATPase involved in chromosome partitioning or flagellar assembly
MVCDYGAEVSDQHLNNSCKRNKNQKFREPTTSVSYRRWAKTVPSVLMECRLQYSRIPISNLKVLIHLTREQEPAMGTENNHFPAGITVGGTPRGGTTSSRPVTHPTTTHGVQTQAPPGANDQAPRPQSYAAAPPPLTPAPVSDSSQDGTEGVSSEDASAPIDTPTTANGQRRSEQPKKPKSGWPKALLRRAYLYEKRYFVAQTSYVNEAYKAKMLELETFRGKSMRPAYSRWFHLLKPRLVIFYFIYAVNLLLRYVLGRYAPHWYAIVRPGLLERWLLAVRTIRRAKFDGTKFIAVYSLKGGIGKTTLTLLLAMFYRLVYKTSPIVAEDANIDSGTLGARVKLTTDMTMNEAIGQIDTINSLATLMTFCSQLKSGLLIMVMGDHKLDGREGLKQLHDRYKRFVGLVFMDLGTSTLSPSNQQGLADAAQVEIATTPAKDSIEQAAKTLVSMIRSEEAHERDLARTSIIMINRWWSFWYFFTSPAKVRIRFIDAMAAQMGLTAKYAREYEQEMGVAPVSNMATDQEIKDRERLVAKAHERAIKSARDEMLIYHRDHLDRLRFMVVGSSIWLALGRRVSHRLVSFRTAVQSMEINAAAAANMNDGEPPRQAPPESVTIDAGDTFPSATPGSNPELVSAVPNPSTTS